MANNIISNKIWNMADVLRDEGVDARDYLAQITYLLFLKMADEYSSEPNYDLNIPSGCDWKTLKSKTGEDVINTYNEILKTLGNSDGILKEIYAESRNSIKTPVTLSRVISMIDSVQWVPLSDDVKGEIYEELLAKTTSDGGAGAGQYFTPRPLINAIVECVCLNPDATISDPCCGSGGFLLASKLFIEKTYGGSLTTPQKKHLKLTMFSGSEIDPDVYKTCLMNLFLHHIGDIKNMPNISRRDSLLSAPNGGERVDFVLTNPPFGIKSNYSFINKDGSIERESTTYNRQDFVAPSSNKQLNFLQHIYSMLKKNGTAAVVLPDSVLSGPGAGETIRRHLLKNADLHTILRLPTGLFYAQGVKANVLFFQKKVASASNNTKEVWIYDLRTDMHFTLKKNPLTSKDLEEFIKCYNPQNREDRYESYNPVENPNGRWRRFTYHEIIERDNASLDIKWIKNKVEYDEVSIQELVDNIKLKSSNIAEAVLKLEELIKGLEE
ncbi:MAG: type I restriction-modification system subunit M [Christensenellaceae bacterium]|jgi:type I restriction enzyme M protein|nr:type I restriction-modification system subunit M [Christensenellaceae bacterium]